MPKKAIVASSKGKGICLALPGPIKQSQSDYESRPTTPTKTQQFYEFILVDTNSVSIKHYKDKSNPELITHSTIQILKESYVPAMLKFFSIFSLSWVFSWQYQYGKSESDHPKSLPILQRHAYVKWWSQFDSSLAYPEKVKEWFKNNPRSLKISDLETASFLNQKTQIQAALAGSQSKKSIKGKLKQILHLLQEDEDLSPDEESDQENEDNPNEDDCFGVNLDDD
ncbi:hypothetical protein PIB30_080960 [Stylosanthes scabra]|uniref:Uncharacterized protein n=1 Tax=Stylosanthes scabra TaxID=79078 RepID=A0ABU6ZQE8_9FABA|nr:hypothetical protein [Stylosanthes scabra]